MLVLIRLELVLKVIFSVTLEFTLCTLCLTSSIFFFTQSYPLAVLLETAEQTLRPGMYDLVVWVNFPVPMIVIKITQTFQI